MGRWACVDVPALPLQLLLQRDARASATDGAGVPACVVEEDAPQARLLWVDECAYRAGIRPGMRYAAALSLSRDLRAGVVGPDEIAQGVERIAARLRDLSPEVEPSAGEPGVFWIDGDGLGRLFESASAWARRVHEAVGGLGFSARVVVGFTRYGTYAVAKAHGAPVVVFRDPGGEQATARGVRLDRLGLEPGLRDDLEKLGVRTLGEFLELPENGLHERFGDTASRVHRLASGAAFAPLRPVEEAPRFVERLELGSADGDRERLLFSIKRLLDPLLARLAERQETVRALRLALRLEDRSIQEESVRPAVPTRHAAQLLDLVRLRLDATTLSAKVEEIELEALPAPADAAQSRLLAENPRRDAGAAGRALARLRAELGPAAVARARLRDGHLPEATFLWEPLDETWGRGTHGEACATGEARGASEAGPSIVRRILDHPEGLPPRPHHLRNDAWLVGPYGDGALVKLTGPFVFSGGWWARTVHREYHYAETARGDLLWVYYDPRRRRWYRHGQIE